MNHATSDITTLIGSITSGWKEELQEFGGYLRARRENLDITQMQMAKLVGVDQSTISRIEHGQAPKNIATLRAIARCYRLDRRELDNWSQLLNGKSSLIFKSSEYGQVLIFGEFLYETIKGMLAKEIPNNLNIYVWGMANPRLYNHILDLYWPELEVIMKWLLRHVKVDPFVKTQFGSKLR